MPNTPDLFENPMQRLKELVRQSVKRGGVSTVAAFLKVAPPTLSNQLSLWNKRKYPRAEVVFACLVLDGQFRKAVARIFDEVLLDAPPEFMEPEDFAREVVAMANAHEFGNGPAARIVEMYRRTKPAGSTWETRARAAGWQPPEATNG